MKFFDSKNNKGIIFSLIMGALFYYLAPILSLMNAVILGLLGGILIGNLKPLSSSYKEGVKWTSTKFLEISILFLAFEINFTSIQKIGFNNFLGVFIVVGLVLAFTLYLNKKMNCPGTAGSLIGFGTAICGSSAIAALAPSISKNKEDVGISLAVVNLLGTLGMLLLPLLLNFINADAGYSGFLIGTSLHSVGNVAGAAYGMSEEIGQTAITIKLARVAILPLGVIVFNAILHKGQQLSFKQHLKLPYYIWGFIIITIITTLFKLPESFLMAMNQGGKIVLTIAMTAIGFQVSFKTLFQSGKKAILFGSVIFIFQLIVITLIQYFLK